jgi:DMSO/TMAO reductase YedYZ molybdopterin-dependent catalytic subunit
VSLQNDAMHRVRMQPAGFFRRIPLLPHQMISRLTPTQDMIVLCHLGIAHVNRETWSLAIDGLVQRPRELRFNDLAVHPKHTIATIHQCAGSPLQPFEPTRRISNVRWGGARLADVLQDCGVLPSARFVWSQGADHGSFGELAHAAYMKDLPIERVSADVLIAYELNGDPLPPEHGFPVRLLVPGFYGTNSVKWLTRLTLAAERVQSPFTTRWYNDPVLKSDGSASGKTTPVWAVAPESIIVEPAPDALLKRGAPVEIWGWSWADDPIERVEVSTDGGDSWSKANLERRAERSWQRFSMSWHPLAEGAVALGSRAYSAAGACQPLAGRRNAVHRVPVVVT